ncbi:MAG: hypothetical protein ACNA8W_25395, partial [Bradymonadaceae bacterium]
MRNLMFSSRVAAPGSPNMDEYCSAQWVEISATVELKSLDGMLDERWAATLVAERDDKVNFEVATQVGELKGEADYDDAPANVHWSTMRPRPAFIGAR